MSRPIVIDLIDGRGHKQCSLAGTDSFDEDYLIREDARVRKCCAEVHQSEILWRC